MHQQPKCTDLINMLALDFDIVDGSRAVEYLVGENSGGLPLSLDPSPKREGQDSDYPVHTERLVLSVVQVSRDRLNI